MAQRARPEARVQQMQNRMLDPADILIDRQPFFRCLAVEWLVLGLAGKADEIPARIDKGIERVGFAPCRFAASRAIDLAPRWMAVERVAGDVEADVLGQYNRQLVVGHRHRAACVAVDDRDRRAPVTLTRNAPVAQAVLRLAVAPAFALRLGDDIGLSLIDRHAVQEMRVHDVAGAGVGDVAVEIAVGVFAVGHHARNAQIIFAGKIEIALVVCRTAENRAGAVVHQHEIGDIDWQMPALVERVFDRQAGVETHLLGGFDVRRRGSAFAAFLDKRLQLGRVRRELLRDRMVGRNRDEACPEYRIGPRGEHVDTA